MSADPCLVYFDENKELCARCKYGMVRMITKTKRIVCGTQTLTASINWPPSAVTITASADKCSPANWYYD